MIVMVLRIGLAQQRIIERFCDNDSGALNDVVSFKLDLF